ncbi:DNA mismatch repair endonuclease MutL [Anatilimnocola floriformis]|uniref:DNA mismatch repair endonuclease MutL n=1 Tax=Anatilimnocola floriformis TaxID=2948575 RepID=UPI0020C51291|nr:DNA mismatch repair endonuclease MutL [Anatilimnocola floriformis]
MTQLFDTRLPTSDPRPASPRIIRQLPQSVINKIAAGEVIERPASVVKELLENALDAGSTRIDVSLGQGGLDLIRVTDNGCGLSPEQMPLALASHATSKIHDADDLFSVGTFGFRGEALASIAEVSHLRLRSRPHDSEQAHELEVIGGKSSPLTPCGAAPGTMLEIRNLFFNTPVRRKFMRASQTEIGHCSEAFTRIALAHERVHFTLRHNDRTLFDLPPVADWRERIAALCGRDLERGLIAVSSTDGAVQLDGFVCDPQFSRSNNRMQYIFLNGRHIRDRSLQHALGESFRGLLLHGRFPIGFLRLNMPADSVDVNVHPTKLEVRFQDSGRIYSLVLGSIRKRFLATDLTAKVRSGSSEDQDALAVGLNPAALDQHRRELVDWAKGALDASAANLQPTTTSTAVLDDEAQGSLDLQYERTSPELQLNALDRSWPAAGNEPTTLPQPLGHSPQRPAPAFVAAPSISHLGFQIHNRYLVTQTDEGMCVIDQHALHERILYEQVRAKVMSGKLECQRLLVPEPVTLPPNEVAAALENKAILSQLGMEVEPFGGDTVLLSSYPAMLANLGPAEMLRQVVDQIVSGGKSPDRRDLLNDLLNMIACKAAIKAGDRLAPEEITALLEQREHYADTHHCPHGRPTALVFTREELDRRFKRT